MPRPDITQYATTETRRKGAERTNEIRREQAKSFRQRLAEKLDERAEEVIQGLLAAGKDDWRASVAAIEQAHGKPTAALEVNGQMEVTNPDVAAAIERFTSLVVQLASRQRPELAPSEPD